jgi:glucose/arabinose dehydrogenase
MEVPRLHSAAKTWAPAGAVFVGESLFFGGLRGEALYEADMRENKLTLKEHFTKEFGRIRDVVLGPDGFLYFSTSNRDGRGDMNEGDDKIIKLVSGLTVKS